jgi:hypothetical protein
MPEPWPLLGADAYPCPSHLVLPNMSCLGAQSVQAGHEVQAHLGLGQLLLLSLPLRIIHPHNLTGYGTASLAEERGSSLLHQLFPLGCPVESHRLVLLL